MTLLDIDTRVKFSYTDVDGVVEKTGSVVGHLPTINAEIVLLDEPIVDPTTGKIETRVLFVLIGQIEVIQ